jgi:TATA-binding protein-associated factor Taf7
MACLRNISVDTLHKGETEDDDDDDDDNNNNNNDNNNNNNTIRGFTLHLMRPGRQQMGT